MTDNKNSSDGDFAGGCLIFIILLITFPIIGMLFPAFRDGLGAPVFELYKDILGVEFPSFPIGPLLVNGLFLTLTVVCFLLLGIGVTRLVQKVFKIDEVNIQLWGAIASILGLIVGIISLLTNK